MNLAAADAMLKMHQDAFDLVTEGAMWIDQSGKIQYANEAAATTLGYSRAELNRASYFEINPHFSLLAWKKAWQRLQERDSEYLETEFVNANGQLFSVRGKMGLDIYSDDPELCLVVFHSREEVQRESDLLDQIQEDGRIGSWEWNLVTNQVFIGAPIRRWFGWSPERDFYPADEFVEKLLPLLAEAEYENSRQVLKDTKRSAREFELPLQIKVKNKEVRFIIRGRSRENELEVYKLIGTMRSAAGEGTLAPASAPQDKLLEFALNHSQDIAWLIDFESETIRYVNNTALQNTGYTRREMLGESVRNFPLPNLHRFFDRLKTEENAPRFERLASVVPRKDGKTPAAEIEFHYIEEKEELPATVLAIGRNTQEKNEGEESIRLHETTLNVLEEWVVWLDRDSNIVLLNEAARRKLSRKTSKELTGLPIVELLPELEIPDLGAVRSDAFDGRLRNAVDYLYTNASGNTRELSVRFSPVSAGRRYFLCMICRDVTKEVTARRKLVQTKRRVDELTRQLQSENEVLREKIEAVDQRGPIITVSKKYQRILGQIGQVAGTDATVLVTGETGTGKELLAQSIHNFSPRSRKPMVSVNCAALPDNLIESELFGHERGAFTGAFTQKKGKFEIANGGTIFLDEIGELPLDMQAKLLRALQEGEIQRIGSTEVLNVDVRVVAATNRNLEKMIGEGRFREDLFYRLNVFPIHNLPLRERPEDIPVLVKHFARQYSERMGRNITLIDPRDLERMQAYDFPGNVRELINLVERAVITSTDSTLNLGESLRALRRSERVEGEIAFRGDRIIAFEEMQKQYIIEALKRTKGKVTGPGGAAELLDLNGRTLMSKMNKLGINRNEYTT